MTPNEAPSLTIPRPQPPAGDPPPTATHPSTTRGLVERLCEALPASAERVEKELTALRAKAGLLRYTSAQRQQLGRTNSALQLRQSLAALQLLRLRKDLLAYLKEASPERLGATLALRTGLCEARRLLRPTMLGAGRAELLLLSEITAACDRIEDQVTAQIQREGLSPAVRRRLEARFVDPARLRQLVEEGAEARLVRRGLRSAKAQREQEARLQRLERVLGKQRLIAAGVDPLTTRALAGRKEDGR